MKTNLAITIAGLALIPASAHAIVIAGTNFDARAVGVNPFPVSNLNWDTNGVDDPGDMNATVGGNPKTLFAANVLVQNMFAPAENLGNNNSVWLTTVDLTVSAGSTVTLEDVTFDYWAISGAQAQNVNRNADFRIILLNPSDVVVETVSFTIANGATPGVGTLATATFTPVALTLPGTYTLQIETGDIVNNHTGNHVGIDDLSINGTVSVAPEPSSTALLGLGGILAILRRRR